MKKYINKTRRMLVLEFKDGFAVFLKRGSKYETSEEPISVPEGVEVIELKKKPDTKRKIEEFTDKE